MAALEVCNIHKSFGKTVVLKGIDFSLEKGKVLSIIGSSGSGKTTLLRCLNFLETADEGAITVGEKVIFDGATAKTLTDAQIRENRLHFGLVFQNFNLFPQYTALENVCLAPRLRAKERADYKQNSKTILAEIEERGKKLLDRVGLSAKYHSYPCELSGGPQQRVAIARALALEPEILFFDEPTSALDPELTGEILRVIRQLADGSMTMVIVTHEMQFAREVSDYVLFMDDGLVVEQGTPDEVIGNPKNERTKAFLARMHNGAPEEIV